MQANITDKLLTHKINYYIIKILINKTMKNKSKIIQDPTALTKEPKSEAGRIYLHSDKLYTFKDIYGNEELAKAIYQLRNKKNIDDTLKENEFYIVYEGGASGTLYMNLTTYRLNEYDLAILVRSCLGHDFWYGQRLITEANVKEWQKKQNKIYSWAKINYFEKDYEN